MSKFFDTVTGVLSNTSLLKYLKSRTIWFAILLALLPIIANYVGFLGLSETGEMVLLQLIGFVVAVLRVLTTVPLDEK
jgi:threonine/homoserine efflux transporter RhtA